MNKKCQGPLMLGRPCNQELPATVPPFGAKIGDGVIKTRDQRTIESTAFYPHLF
jgi:hypothetical protein